MGAEAHRHRSLVRRRPSGWHSTWLGRGFLALGLAGTLVAGVVTGVTGVVRADDRPNILLIVTDDQRWDTIGAMPRTMRRIAQAGVNFPDAHVVTPMCCPSRAAILTGQYAHTNGVYGNHISEPGGGFNAFDDSVTIATVLHDAGYRTALSGKYLNGYGNPEATEPPTYVPPGWEEWYALSKGTLKDYYGYGLNENGTIVEYGSDPADYVTDVTGAKILEFIRRDEPGPWFAEWTPTAPHADAVPEADHAHDFDGIAPWRPPSYNESDVTDKPLWVQRRQPIPVDRQPGLDGFRENQLETLQSVDEWVGVLLDAAGRNTIVIFMSDNGFLWGEHQLTGKKVPYEEATRVPFAIAGAGIPKGVVSDALVTNIDVAPTIADAGGTSMPEADGVSILPFLGSDWRGFRDEHLIEHQLDGDGRTRDMPAWCQLRSPGHVFTHYGSGEEEYYNLTSDPYQLTNRIANGKAQPRIAVMRNRLRTLCDPLPPGMPAF